MASDKGGKFERDQSRFLSLWWSEGKDPDIFWRNRTRATQFAPKAEHQLSDQMCTKSSGLPFTETFSVELKSGYSKQKASRLKNQKGQGKFRNVPWDLLEIIDSNQIDDYLTILQFWKQCQTDADITGRIPILIFKRDFHQPVVCMKSADLDILWKCKNRGKYPERNIVLESGNFDLEFFRQDDFFKWLTPKMVKELHKERK